MNKDVLAPHLRGFVSGVIDTPSKGVSRYTSAVLLIFTLALSACGGENLPTAESLLAVAYINSDGQPGYSESDDILIAGLYDTNDDGFPSSGDTVIYGEYPLGFGSGSGTGPFLAISHTVDQAFLGLYRLGDVVVRVGSREMVWYSSGNLEIFGEAPPAAGAESLVLLVDDSLSGTGKVYVAFGSIGSPSTELDINSDVPAEISGGAFLDVQIFVVGDT